METWKPVPGYEGLYEVSSTGRIKFLTRTVAFKDGKRKRTWPEKIMKLQIGNNGYHALVLWNHNKPDTQYVHRLVLLAFHGPCPANHQCRHLNGNRLDNRLENLQWGTQKQNEADKNSHNRTPRGESHGNAKLTNNQVHEIRRLYSTGKFLMKHLATKFMVSQTTIVFIISKKHWAHLPDKT